SGATFTVTDALVGALVEIWPPNTGAPSVIDGLEGKNKTPLVMSCPPKTIVAVVPRAIRGGKPGRVRFKPLELFGATRMSGTETPETSAICATKLLAAIVVFPKYVVPKSVLAPAAAEIFETATGKSRGSA